LGDGYKAVYVAGGHAQYAEVCASAVYAAVIICAIWHVGDTDRRYAKKFPKKGIVKLHD
jgi:hypothetical protein